MQWTKMPPCEYLCEYLWVPNGRVLSQCHIPCLQHHCWDLYPVVLSQYSWPCLSENQGPRVDFILRPLCELRPRDTGLGSHRVPIVHFFNIVQTAFDPTPHPPWTMFKKMCYCYKMASLKCLLRKAPCQMFRYFSLFFKCILNLCCSTFINCVFSFDCICLAFLSTVCFQMFTQITCLRRCIVTLVTYVWPIVYYQMSPEISFMGREIVTLVAFVWLFPLYVFKWLLKLMSWEKNKVTLVAFVWLFSTVCFQMLT